jgi:hypothetical protein
VVSSSLFGEDGPPTIGKIFTTSLYFNWSWPGTGWGETSVNIVDGKLSCMNECMSRESIRTLLVAYANKVADEMILEE